METRSPDRIGPVRITLDALTPDEIRRRNADVHGGRPIWDEDVEALVARIDSIRWDAPVAPETLEHWATHPDERVRVALLRANLIWGPVWRRHASTLTSLILRTDADTRPEHEAWNPTLDALARLPRRRTWNPRTWIEKHVAPELLKRGITCDEARRLLHFTNAPDLARAVLATVPPDIAFVRWLAAHKPDDLATLSCRGDLPVEVDAEIWRIALEACEIAGSRISAPALIRRLRSRGMLPGDALVQLLDLAERQGAGIPNPDAFFKSLDIVLEHTHILNGVTPDILRRIYQVVRDDQKRVESLVANSETELDLCIHIAADTRFEAVRDAIASRFGWSPDIQRILRKTTSRRVLTRLARWAKGEELVPITNQMARRYPTVAIETLTKKLEEGAIDLELCREPLERYVERIIEINPQVALAQAENVSKHLGEPDIRLDWLRKIARKLARRNPMVLRRLSQIHREKLEPEDWLDALQSSEVKDVVVRTLLSIPSAVQHPEARRFIFQYGLISEITQLLEMAPPQAGEEPIIARAILRLVPHAFETYFERWPSLKNSLDPADISDLLMSANTEIRQKVILLLADLSTSGANPQAAIDPQPHQRSRSVH